MNRILLDAKRLLLGEDDSEKVPADFKEEINNSIKNNIINKAMATLLMTARNNADILGKKIVKKQEDDVSGKGARVSDKKVKEIIYNEEKAEIRRKKLEEEKDKKRKQESLRQTMQRIAAEDEKAQNNAKIKNKDF